MSTTVSIPVGNAPLAGSVTLGKPWFLSKKVWVAVISTVAVIVSAYFGKADTTAEVLDKIQKTAGIVLIAAPLILSIAHVDGKERELILGLLKMAKSIETPDAGESPVPAVPASDSAKVPGLDR